jgi:hypothetical protein
MPNSEDLGISFVSSMAKEMEQHKTEIRILQERVNACDAILKAYAIALSTQKEITDRILSNGIKIQCLGPPSQEVVQVPSRPTKSEACCDVVEPVLSKRSRKIAKSKIHEVIEVAQAPVAPETEQVPVKRSHSRTENKTCREIVAAKLDKAMIAVQKLLDDPKEWSPPDLATHDFHCTPTEAKSLMAGFKHNLPFIVSTGTCVGSNDSRIYSIPEDKRREARTWLTEHKTKTQSDTGKLVHLMQEGPEEFYWVYQDGTTSRRYTSEASAKDFARQQKFQVGPMIAKPVSEMPKPQEANPTKH